PRRHGTRNPLFDVMLVFHPLPPGSREPAEQGFSFSKAPSAMPKADWVLTVAETPSDWLANLEFDALRSSLPRARRLLSDLLHLLEGFAADPSRPLARSIPFADAPPEVA